jgi:hypothetical protein
MSHAFSIKTMWRSMFCALVATFTLSVRIRYICLSTLQFLNVRSQAMNPFRTGKLVLFQLARTTRFAYPIDLSVSTCTWLRGPSLRVACISKNGINGDPWVRFPRVGQHWHDRKRIYGYSRDCLVVKFIVNHFESNKITVWMVKEATRHLMRWYIVTILRKGFWKYPIIVTQL